MERFSRQQTSAAPQRPHQPAAAPASAASTKSKGSKPSFASKLLVVVLIVAALAVTVALAVAAFGNNANGSKINSDEYQAVFLDNGQVYFGKLSNLDSRYVELSDIYYLQVSQQVQPDQNADKTTPQQNISLAKLGNELHGPEDLMLINPAKIVFWENLKPDGQVTKAISEYKANPPSDQQNQDQQQTAPDSNTP